MIFQHTKAGNSVSGTLAGSTDLASGRYAMIEDGLGFSLVPWHSILDQRVGQHITGAIGGDGESSGIWAESLGWGCEGTDSCLRTLIG